jgi:CubicO group peptidase (beta-lactamase class C family)
LGSIPYRRGACCEIGFCTDVFTALLLARLAIEGDIDPDRPISDYCKAFA